MKKEKLDRNKTIIALNKEFNSLSKKVCFSIILEPVTLPVTMIWDDWIHPTCNWNFPYFSDIKIEKQIKNTQEYLDLDARIQTFIKKCNNFAKQFGDTQNDFFISVMECELDDKERLADKIKQKEKELAKLKKKLSK